MPSSTLGDDSDFKSGFDKSESESGSESFEPSDLPDDTNNVTSSAGFSLLNCLKTRISTAEASEIWLEVCNDALELSMWKPLSNTKFVAGKTSHHGDLLLDHDADQSSPRLHLGIQKTSPLIPEMEAWDRLLKDSTREVRSWKERYY